jgi:hypothetical protein
MDDVAGWAALAAGFLDSVAGATINRFYAAARDGPPLVARS